MEKSILKALYYIRKNQILHFYRVDSEKSQISDSFAYAISKDCFPYFHSDDEIEMYGDCFSIKYDFIDAVIKYIDESWLQKKYYTFYELEDKFGRENRPELIVILRYCFLDGRFGGNDFWKKLEEYCPSEAHGLSAPLKEWDI